MNSSSHPVPLPPLPSFQPQAVQARTEPLRTCLHLLANCCYHCQDSIKLSNRLRQLRRLLGQLRDGGQQFINSRMQPFLLSNESTRRGHRGSTSRTLQLSAVAATQHRRLLPTNAVRVSRYVLSASRVVNMSGKPPSAYTKAQSFYALVTALSSLSWTACSTST